MWPPTPPRDVCTRSPDYCPPWRTGEHAETVPNSMDHGLARV